MNEVTITETFGNILGMDQMCTGKAPDSLTVGTSLALHRESAEPIRVTVAALQAHKAETGEPSELVGIGLRGSGAHLIAPGDTLVVEAPDRDAMAAEKACNEPVEETAEPFGELEAPD